MKMIDLSLRNIGKYIPYGTYVPLDTRVYPLDIATHWYNFDKLHQNDFGNTT